MSNRHRAVVVGLNHYHVTGWVESLNEFQDRVEIVGRYDPSPERRDLDGPDNADPNLAQQFPAWFRSVPFYSDLGTLIRDARPNIAVVTLPNVAAPGAIQHLAEAGVHLLVDKPGARTALEARAAFASESAENVKIALALTRRYGQSWIDARQAIRAGRLGKLLTAEAIFVTSSVAVRDPANQIFSREAMGGGILHWLGVHDVDLLLWMAGEPIVEVQAMSAMTNGANIDVEDTISVAFRFESGALGTMHFAYALPRPGGNGYAAFRGSSASLSIEPNGTQTWIHPGTSHDPMQRQVSTYELAPAIGYGSVGLRIIDDLLGAIAENRPPLATGAHAIRALEVIDAIYEAASTGTRVRVAGHENTEASASSGNKERIW